MYVTETGLKEDTVDGLQFRFVEGKTSHSNLYGDYVIEAKWKGGWSRICCYGSWAFSSCAVASLCGFNRSYNGFWGDKKQVAAFVKWLSTTKSVRDVSAGYFCGEYYLLLPNDTINYLRDFSKKVDEFQNKAHDSSGLALYRLSLDVPENQEEDEE